MLLYSVDSLQWEELFAWVALPKIRSCCSAVRNRSWGRLHVNQMSLHWRTTLRSYTVPSSTVKRLTADELGSFCNNVYSTIKEQRGPSDKKLIHLNTGVLLFNKTERMPFSLFFSCFVSKCCFNSNFSLKHLIFKSKSKFKHCTRAQINANRPKMGI